MYEIKDIAVIFFNEARLQYILTQLTFDFRETVLEEKLILRAPLQDSELSSAETSISDVYRVNFDEKHRH